jgi:hypothetical protein
MKLRLIISGVIALVAPAAHGQVANASNVANAASRVAEQNKARDDAAEALKGGDVPAAMAKLRAAAAADARVVSEDSQVAGNLCAIARSMTADRHRSGPNTTALALSETAKARSRSSGREAAYLDVQAAGVYETVLGDHAKARQAYQSALAQDASRQDAAAGLKRLDRLEALMLAKAQENAALRNRGK